jgi:hypothetical protein
MSREDKSVFETTERTSSVALHWTSKGDPQWEIKVYESGTAEGMARAVKLIARTDLEMSVLYKKGALDHLKEMGRRARWVPDVVTELTAEFLGSLDDDARAVLLGQFDGVAAELEASLQAAKNGKD